MVTMFFAHGPTVLTNQVRYDTKRHFLKIFFVVYSIIINILQTVVGGAVKKEEEVSSVIIYRGAC